MQTYLCLLVSLSLALAEPDPAKRARAVLPFLDSPSGFADALRTWESSGTAAIPVLRSLLADETRLAQHEVLLDTLVTAGGATAVPVLEDLLRDERVFWNNLGMNLDEQAKLPAQRADRLTAILRHLAALGYADANGLVRAVHDQFHDHPILCEYGRSIEADGSVCECPVIAAAQAILLRK